jgi:hypothetical protein
VFGRGGEEVVSPEPRAACPRSRNAARPFGQLRAGSGASHFIFHPLYVVLVRIHILVLIASSVAAWPQTAAQKNAPPGALHTFTSPDGSFQITYSDVLIRCELRLQKGSEKAYEWKQPECVAYIPVCDADPNPDTSLLCLAYPRNQYSDTSVFEAAAFSVSETSGNEKDCIGAAARTGKTVEIGGVKFYRTEEGDAGMSHHHASRDYLTYRNGKCYDMSVAVSTTSGGAFDPPQPEFSESDWKQIRRPLEQARDSFRFLK